MNTYGYKFERLDLSINNYNLLYYSTEIKILWYFMDNIELPLSFSLVLIIIKLLTKSNIIMLTTTWIKPSLLQIWIDRENYV